MAIMPCDPEVERAVLADQIYPLHGDPHGRVKPDDFYDERHRRILRAARTGTELGIVDDGYLADVVRTAPPITKDTYATFGDLAARRRRLLELEAERCDLLGPEPVASARSGGDGVVLLRASDIKPERVEYLDDNLIPLRVVTLTVGLDGVGKSTAMYSKAAAATRGLLPGAYAGTPVDVVIASSEDHPGSVIKPRLCAAGADLDRVHVVKVHRDGITADITLPDDLDDLSNRVVEVGARMLIIDPLVAHLPMSIDSYKAQHIRRVLAPLAHLAEEHHLAVVAVVHFNGGPSSDVRSRISGSKAIRDASRSVLVFGTDPDDESRFVMVQDKHSFGPKATTGRTYRIEETTITIDGESYPTSMIEWGDTINLTANEVLRTGDAEDRSERDNAREFVLEMLADGPMLSEQVKLAAKSEGISPKVLRSAREDLKVEISRQVIPGKKGRGPSLWALPNTCPRPDEESAGHVLAESGTVTPQGLQDGFDQPDLIDAHCRTQGTYSDDEAVAEFAAMFDAEIVEER